MITIGCTNSFLKFCGEFYVMVNAPSLWMLFNVFFQWPILRRPGEKLLKPTEPDHTLSVISSENGANTGVRGCSWGFGSGLDAVEELSRTEAHLEAPGTCHNSAHWKRSPASRHSRGYVKLGWKLGYMGTCTSIMRLVALQPGASDFASRSESLRDVWGLDCAMLNHVKSRCTSRDLF